jgi:hypothetical protein
VDVGVGHGVVVQHAHQRTTFQLLRDVPQAAQHDAVAGQTPVAHHLARVAGEWSAHRRVLHLGLALALQPPVVKTLSRSTTVFAHH